MPRIDCPVCGSYTSSNLSLSYSQRYREGKCPQCGTSLRAQSGGSQAIGLLLVLGLLGLAGYGLWRLAAWIIGLF